MKFTSKLVFFIISISILSCQSNEVLFEDALCIQNISTIDPTDGLKDNQTIVIKHGKIHKIADTATLALSKENNIIDGTEKYMIPGIWDAHVHFAYIEEMAPSMFDLFLTHGITSVRDTGGKVDFVKQWKDKALANPMDAPRVMMAGPLLDGEPNVYDGSDAAHPELSVGLDNIEAVTKEVNVLLSKNVDLLKAYEMLTPEQFVKINELAQANGLKLTGHIPLSMDAISASNSGMNSIEHMRNLEISCASNAEELWQQRKEMLLNKSNLSGGGLRSSIHTAQREIAIDNYDEAKATEVLKVLQENDTWQIPTQALNTIHTRKYYTRPDWHKSYELLPKELTKLWLEQSNTFSEKAIPKGKEKWNQWNYMMVKKIHETGIPIMAGTDTPIAFLTPGLSLHEELAVLVEDVGLSTLDALRTATINPAKYFDMENELGSIKENMWADLVILDSNPIENIQNTKRINSVIKQGKVFDRKSLDENLEKLRNN
jgi:imidazolonepropionase-like amidohydrolase